MMRPLVYLIAGEPSGDLLGGRLMSALLHLTGGNISFAGIGGEMMGESGLNSLFPQSDLAVMGLFEVVPKIPVILRRLNQTISDIIDKKPDVIVTIDSWGFTGRVARKLRAMNSSIPRIHYVAPMVWVWKEKRARQVAGLVHRLLCLLPYEPAWFIKEGLQSVYVGHPVLEGKKGDASSFRQRHKIPETTPLLCLLPGSRQLETSRLLPVFEESVEVLCKRIPGLMVVVPTVETVADEVAAAARNWSFPNIVLRGTDERMDAFAASRAALAASGTVALELGHAGVPMVIAYRVSVVTAMIARRLVKVPFVCLINILAGKMVVPEFLQRDCRPDRIAMELLALMLDDKKRQEQFTGIRAAIDMIAEHGEWPSVRAAKEILLATKDFAALQHKT